MATRDILDNSGNVVGELTLPDDTTEDIWTAKLAEYSQDQVTWIRPPDQVVIAAGLPAFAAKTLVISGVTKNLFKRFTGISQALSAGSNTFTWTQATFPWVKFLGLEVIGAELGDTCDLYVLDTATGTYSGHANYTLNQFAFAANIRPAFYKHVSEYDADLFQNLQFKFVYNSVSGKTIYINFDMNEVK